MYGIDYTDAIAHKGKVVAVTGDGDVYVWDIVRADAPPELVRPPRQYQDQDWIKRTERRWKLAESADGRRLLLVCTYGSPDTSCWRFQAQGVHLFERDLDATTGVSDGGGGGWAPVTSLGDYSLFLGVGYPFMARSGLPVHGSRR
ncbi:unnamed protein product [Urochloa humidicola]